MKSFFLALLVMMISITVMGNDIIYKSNNAIFLYNIEKKETIRLINCAKNFSIGRILYKNDAISFILYNDLEFAASSSSRVIDEKEYLIKDKKCILQANSKLTLVNKNHLITQTDDSFYLESVKVNGEKSLSVINSYNDFCERYYNHYKYSDSNINYNIDEGSISIFEKGKWNCIFKGIKNRGILCAYYDANLSLDGNYLIYSYGCFKHNHKKLISCQLFEMNTKNRTINDLSFLSGSSAKYSEDARFILYRKNDGHGFAIYERDNNSTTSLNEAEEAYWIFSVNS